MKLEFSPLSIADLRTILEYISHDKPQAALNFVAQIEDRCKLPILIPCCHNALGRRAQLSLLEQVLCLLDSRLF